MILTLNAQHVVFRVKRRSTSTGVGTQTVVLSGDVTGSGAGYVTTTIADNSVLNSKLSQVATSTFKGRTTAGTGNVEDLTATQATALLNEFTSSLKGLAPASGGGTSNFLRADGSWAAPPGGGGGVADGDKGDITVSSTGTVWTIDNSVVTLAKMSDLATNTIIGRVTASTGVPEALTSDNLITVLNTASTNTINFARLSGVAASSHNQAWSTITSTPTTLSGYGITDALSNSTSSTQSGYFGDIFLYDDSTPSHYLQITNSANLTAARILSVNVNDADRTVSLSGNLTVSSAATISGTNTGDQTITLTGDVTGTGTGSFTATIASSAVTLAKMANLAQNTIIGRVTASTGVPEALTSDNLITVLNTASTNTINFARLSGVAASATTLAGYGITDALSNSTSSTQSGYFGDIYLYDDSTPSHYLQITNSANLSAARILSVNVNDADRTISLSGNLTVSSAATISGTNTGDQTITLTGDVTGTGTGSFTATIASSAVTLAKMSDLATNTIIGRVTASTGVPEALTSDNLITVLNTASTNTINFARLAGVAASSHNQAWSTITSTPTTLSGYGITDALSNSTSSTQSGYFGDIFLYDDSTPSHYLQITNSANLSAARILSVNVNDADRTISLSGNLTVSSAATISGTNTGDQTITLTGDVTGTGTGSFAATIASSAVTLAKMANLAQNTIIGRVTASTGVPEALTSDNLITVLNTASTNTINFARLAGVLSNSTSSTQSGYFGDIFLYDDSTPSHYLQITNSANLTLARVLSLNVNDADRTVSLSGNLTVSSAATISGTNTGDQTITLTGDVTGTGTGSFATTIASSAVTLAKMANLAQNTIIGRVTASTGVPEALTSDNLITVLNTASTNTINFARLAGVAASSHNQAWSTITSTPTTLSGYGITDAVTLTGSEVLTNKTLTSPTINGGTIQSRPQASSETTGTLTNASANKTISATGNITINNSVFTAGDIIVIYAGASSRTLTQGVSVTMRLAGSATTGSRTLAAYGIATLYFNSTSEVIVGGTGVT